MKNIPLMLSGTLLDATRCILPQITQIAQKRICENLRNLRLKSYNFKTDNMKRIFFLLIPLFVFSCTTEQKNDDNVSNDSLKVIQPVKDSLALSDSFITGNWKLVWISGDSLKITPNMRIKLLKVKIFFKFNADKSFYYIFNDKTTKGIWKIYAKELCIRLGIAKNDRCVPIKIINSDKISFPYQYSKELEAEVTLSRVLNK